MIYFFYGDEEFNITKEIKKMKSSLDKNFIEMSYKTYDNPKYPDLISIVSSQPMMFGKMIIVIDCLKYFSSKSGGESCFDDKQLKELSDVLDNCNENLDIIFRACTDPEEKQKIDKRKKLFKILSKYESKEFPQIPSYKTAELESWVKESSKEKKLKISNDIAQVLILQVGNNLRLLDNELEKLKVYAGDNPVTKQMVQEICVNNDDLFVFTDCITEGNIERGIAEYQKLVETRHPLAILAVLHSILHSKIYLKANSSKYSQDELAKSLNMHPYRVKMELQKLKNVSLQYLVSIKEKLTDAEYKIKSGQSNLTPEKEVEYAILR